MDDADAEVLMAGVDAEVAGAAWPPPGSMTLNAEEKVRVS
jgi:hypothetical protein